MPPVNEVPLLILTALLILGGAALGNWANRRAAYQFRPSVDQLAIRLIGIDEARERLAAVARELNEHRRGQPLANRVDFLSLLSKTHRLPPPGTEYTRRVFDCDWPPDFYLENELENFHKK